MNTHLKLKTLLVSTALGLLILPCTQAAAQTAAAGNEVEEVVVTAQKRTETSLVVPMGLTALSGDQLEAKQAFRLEDVVGKVPGLNMSETLGAQLVVRGIASTASSINAPVATYIDDTPLVGIGSFSGGFANTPNLDTFDLKRIEVLKGPQGTLYGASALGGLLKYVTNEPDLTGFAGKLQAGATARDTICTA
jgi:iron complex outermembrane recepter protein